MSITHEQARKLIQQKLDQALNVQESATLSAHLHHCSQCQAYANEIQEVENILFPIMKRQWSARPVPLSIAALTEKSFHAKTNTLLTMRTTAISLVVMALFFSAWQFVLSGPSESSAVPLAIPPVPTPSALTAQSTRAHVTIEGCTLMQYTVRENDTLAAIAEQFAIAEDAIVELNHLETEVLSPAMELVIPSCNFTRTGTFHPATFTTTYTPVVNQSTSTPGG